jgi:outer membrane protein assembly factor BamB
LNATTGDKIWSYTIGNGILSTPAFDNGVLYISSTNGNVYALRVSPATSPSSKPSNNLPIIIGVVVAVVIVAAAVVLMFLRKKGTPSRIRGE